MPFVRVGDLRMYYELGGNGPRVLFINGTGGDLRARPGPFDGPLAGRFELLAHDQRGLGQTDRPDVPYAMADYAADAAGLLSAVGWSRCHVVGVSFGGMVAQELALRWPDHVDRLVLACTSSGGAGGASYPLHELEHLPEEERLRRTLALGDTRRDAAWQRDHPEELAGILQFMRARTAAGVGEPGREAGARRQLEARRTHDTWDRLHTLRQPTFVCGGKYDAIASPANQEALARRIPNATLELFDGGHLFLLQDSRAFDRIIDFLTAA